MARRALIDGLSSGTNRRQPIGARDADLRPGFQDSRCGNATIARSPLPEGQQPALFVLADICTVQGVQEVVDRLLRNRGGIDILVNWGCAPRPQFTGRVARDDRSRSFRDSQHHQEALYFAFR